MGLFGTSNKNLQAQVARYTAEYTEQQKIIRDLEARNEYLHAQLYSVECDLESMNKLYPIDVGDTVYTLVLKNAKGRFVKKNASPDHSFVSSVEVTRANYFKLVDKIDSGEAFKDLCAAEAVLREKCGVVAEN